MDSSNFIRPIHPKTEIRPIPDAIRKILGAGWIGQLKMHGHRAQIHISADPKQEILVFNRQGQHHKKQMPSVIESELRRLFTPTQQWNIIDAEWIKNEDRIFVFDFLKCEGELLNRLNFLSRWKYLPRAYISPSIQTLGILTTLKACLEALNPPSADDSLLDAFVEGLVFKSSSPGFEDSSIIRCRKVV